MFGEQLVDEHASVSAEKRNLANFAARQVAAKLAKLAKLLRRSRVSENLSRRIFATV